MGRWKGQSKGQEVGRPWTLLDTWEQPAAAGELEAHVGGGGRKWKRGLGAEHRRS